MSSTCFISDLHLDPARPAVTRALAGYLDRHRQCDQLYILGDLFEAWPGDDDDSPLAARVLRLLRDFSAAGPGLFIMPGNRDFLLGRRFCDAAGASLLPDPTVIDLYGEPTLLMHGDLLCSDDHAYQAFRRQVRDPAWQAQFLAQPLAARQAFAAKARAASQAHQAGVSETITDVTPATVEATLAHYGVSRLIHGHTHRPAEHRLQVAGREARRTVLGDWYEQGSVLRVDAAGQQLAALA